MDGYRTAAGLIVVDGYYYYARSGGLLATGYYYVTNHNMLTQYEGLQAFAADGRMVDEYGDPIPAL